MLLDDCLFLFRRHDIAECDRNSRTSGPVESGVLQGVERCRNHDLRVLLGKNLDDFGDDALVRDIRHVREVSRKEAVEDRLSESRLECLTFGEALRSGSRGKNNTGNANLDCGVDVQLVQVVGHEAFRDSSERASLARNA